MSALDLIRSRTTVDIDQLDPDIASRLGPFQDMSESITRRIYNTILALTLMSDSEHLWPASNQALISGVVCDPARLDFLKEVVAKAKSQAEGDDVVEVALDLFVSWLMASQEGLELT